MLQIDLNCDMGEGMENDEVIMPLITSANIACGYHAGDWDTMKKTVALCIKYHVNIGAHPSYPDRKNFGRVDLAENAFKLKDIYRIVADQVNDLQEICLEYGTKLHHVKPHGALYNRAATNTEVSSLICEAIQSVDNDLILYGLSISEMSRQATMHKLKFMHEVFADRTYQDDGTLTPRSKPEALINSIDEVLSHVSLIINEQKVKTISGIKIPVIADTICIHGDGQHATDFAKSIHKLLTNAYGR